METTSTNRVLKTRSHSSILSLSDEQRMMSTYSRFLDPQTAEKSLGGRGVFSLKSSQKGVAEEDEQSCNLTRLPRTRVNCIAMNGVERRQAVQ